MIDSFIWIALGLLVLGTVFAVCAIIRGTQHKTHTATHMQYVYALCAEEDSAIVMWWMPGCCHYLYQTIDNVSGTSIDKANRVHSAVNVDAMYGDNLSIVAQECWIGYEIMEFNTDYTG